VAGRGLSVGFWVAVGAVVLAAIALPAAAAAAPNPPGNITMGPLPESCSNTTATSASCENAVVYYLDKARASLGLSPYALPADFVQLPPDRQIFILSNLDRLAYSLPPVSGLNQDLSASAATGVAVGDDPQLGDWSYGWNGYYSNWAGGYVNAPEAYYGWVYDDGYGSGNLACKTPSDWGCWGHRQNVLFEPGGGGGYESAMGASAGTEPASGRPGYAMLIVTAASHFTPQPPYYYSWAEAVADGAGTNPYDPGAPDLTEAGGESEPGPSAVLRILGHGPRLRIRGGGFVLGRKVKIRVRREIVPCAIRRRARRCGWVRRGRVRRLSRTLTAHTVVRVRPPGPWERVVVRAVVRSFERAGQRYPTTSASRLLRGRKPRRIAH
jgi:hypothetical protein